MHGSKQPAGFSFLQTSRAPQNKTTKIDFFFKKDPRLGQAIGTDQNFNSSDYHINKLEAMQNMLYYTKRRAALKG